MKRTAPGRFGFTRTTATGARVTAAATAVVLVAAGCSTKDTTPVTDAEAVEGTVRIAYLPLVQANPYVQATLKGLEAAAAEDGDAEITTFDGALDGTTQAQQCQDVVASGRYDAIVTIPVNPTNLTACIEDAIAKGIRVANTDFPLGADSASGEPQIEGMIASILDPATTRGEWLFELIAHACGEEECQVGLITGLLADPYSVAVNEAITGLAKKTDNIEIVALQEGFYLTDTALPVAQDMLQAHPDLDVITTNSDPMTLGAQQAVEKAGRTGKVKLIGGGYSSLSPDAIKTEDWVGTFLSLPFDEGNLAGTYVLQACRGEDVSMIGESAVVESGLPPVITKDNLAELKELEPQWAGS